MAKHGKTAYIDFTIPFAGIDTAVRIFEIETHVFVYVNQNPPEIHLYNDILRMAIQNKCKHLKGKEFIVICNLANHEALDPIAQHISEILTS